MKFFFFREVASFFSFREAADEIYFFREAASEHFFFPKSLLFRYFSIHFGVYNKILFWLCG
jgi:hypothetical protein